MKARRSNQQQSLLFLPSLLLLTIICTLFTSFIGSATPLISTINNEDIDVNGDGTINILVLGTNGSINGSEIFSPNQIVEELQNILTADEAITIDVNVVVEDIHMSQLITVGLGGGGTEYDWTHIVTLSHNTIIGQQVLMLAWIT